MSVNFSIPWFGPIVKLEKGKTTDPFFAQSIAKKVSVFYEENPFLCWFSGTIAIGSVAVYYLKQNPQIHISPITHWLNGVDSSWDYIKENETNEK